MKANSIKSRTLRQIVGLFCIGVSAALLPAAVNAMDQIDSMDNVGATGWASNPAGVTSSGTGEPVMEGTASMKLPGSGAADNIQAWRVLSTPIDLSPESDNFLQFWVHGDGSANQFQVFLFLGENDMARSIHTITWEGWRPFVVRAKNVGPDNVAAFNYGNVAQIDFFIQGVNPRNDIFVDDLRVGSDPTLEMVVSSFDNDPWNESIGSAGGSPVFDTEEKTDGRSSLTMAYSSSAFAEQYFAVLMNYEASASSARSRDLSKWDRLTFDLHGDGSGAELDLRMSTGSFPYYYYIPIDFTGWQSFSIPRAAFSENVGADWADIDTIRMFNRTDGTAMTIKIDNMRMTSDAPPSDAVDIAAANVTINVDGDPSDWANVLSDSVPLDTGGRGDLTVDVTYAWDADNLYILMQEGPGDTTQQEAANQTAYAEPYNYDGVAFWMDLDSSLDGEQTAQDFNPWFGLTSTERSDLFAYRANNDSTFIASTPSGITIATSGSQANNDRVIEASIPWATLALVVDSGRQPGGDIEAAIEPGFSFGSQPLLIDDDFNAQSYIGGGQFTVPNGLDENSRNVVLSAETTSVDSWLTFD